jgi:hypothetical protein
VQHEHVQGHGLRARQGSVRASTRDERRRELWTTRAQPWCVSASGSGESWRKALDAMPTRAWVLGRRHFLYIHGFVFELLLLLASELSGCREARRARLQVQLIQIAGG